jgi:predicted dinucleotide-binding enzyme
MTWELAESGKDFITSLVNRNDVVPAFSKVSTESLRSEVPLWQLFFAAYEM